MIFVANIKHDFGFTVDVSLTLSLALIIMLEEWGTEDYIGSITERLLKRTTIIWHNLPYSVYVSFRVFCHLMRPSLIIPSAKITTKFALRLISDMENRSSLKERTCGET